MAVALVFTALVSTSGVASEDNAVHVRSRSFALEYEVNDQALPLDLVQLWYTTDRGKSWNDFVLDEDRQSPVVFEAPREGLFGFTLILTNATGPSGSTPQPGDTPQIWAFVDYTPPVVQLHPLRQTSLLGQRVLQIRWTAIDAHLDSRPLTLEYRQPPDTVWRSVVGDPLANTGRFDWRLPETLLGSVAIRLTVSDLGGHRVNSKEQVAELAVEVASEVAGVSTAQPFRNTSGEATASLAGSPRSRERAQRLFDQAMALQDRGEYREGIIRLREAVKLDPHRAEAFAEMGAMLYRIGDSERALGAFELALRQDPNMRSALRGAAMLYRRRDDHPRAAALLRTILRRQPDDAEVWMNLGDVAVFQGDEILARECYTRASRVDPSAEGVIADARKRLDLMARASRNYHPTNDN